MGGEKEEVWSTGEEFKVLLFRRRERERERQTARTRTEPQPELRDMDVTAAMDEVGAHWQHLHCLIAAEPEVRGQGHR